MKLKPNQTRTYDGDGFKKRAACLCFKNEREEEVRKQCVISVKICIYVFRGLVMPNCPVIQGNLVNDKSKTQKRRLGNINWYSNVEFNSYFSVYLFVCRCSGCVL